MSKTNEGKTNGLIDLHVYWCERECIIRALEREAKLYTKNTGERSNGILSLIKKLKKQI